MGFVVTGGLRIGLGGGGYDEVVAAAVGLGGGFEPAGAGGVVDEDPESGAEG